MEIKITEVTIDGTQPTVVVGFFDGEDKISEKRYSINPGQTIEDIKPKIKEDLNVLESANDTVNNLIDKVGESINLKGVKTISEVGVMEPNSSDRLL